MRLTRQAALAIALICGLFAAVLAWMYIGRQAKPKAPVVETVEVPVPIKTLPPQLDLQPEMFKKLTFEKTKLPAGVMLTEQDLAGRISLMELPEGQPVRADQIAVRSKKLGLAYTLPEGSRAMSISLDIVGAVGDFLQPGTHVDVLVSFERENNAVVRTVTQDVVVLAVGTATNVAPPAAEQPAAGKTGTEQQAPRRTETPVTLQVTPTQAQLVLTADVSGDIRLTLRPMGDRAIVPLPNSNNWSMIGEWPKPKQPGAQPASGAQQEQQAGQQQPPIQQYGGPQGPQAWGARPVAPAPPQPKRPSVEVIRGGQREVVTP
ncbi:MAG: Flp pilus assembly protein CpaB [Armatimonadia bacterium]